VTLSSGPGLDSARYEVDEDRLELTRFDFAAPLPLGLGRPLLGTLGRGDADRAGVPAERPSASDGEPAADPRPDDEGPYLVTPLVGLRAGWLVAEDQPTRAQRSALPGGYVELRTLSVGAGVGARIQLAPWLRADLRADLVQSRTTSHAAGDPPGRTLLASLDGVVVGWRAETLTGVLQLSASARIPAGPLLLLPRVTVAGLYTRTYSQTSSLQRAEGWSTTLLPGLDIEAPLFGLALGDYPLVLTVGGTWIHFEGYTGQAFGFRELFAFPVSLQVDFLGEVPLLRRLGVSAEYVGGQGVRGWAVGLAFELEL
jgi:hypothetical protein